MIDAVTCLAGEAKVINASKILSNISKCLRGRYIMPSSIRSEKEEPLGPGLGGESEAFADRTPVVKGAWGSKQEPAADGHPTTSFLLLPESTEEPGSVARPATGKGYGLKTLPSTPCDTRKGSLN